MFEHILVPLDGSEEARKALALAVAIAEKFGARLTLLYAVDLNANMSGLDRVTMSGYIPETILETGYKLLAEAARRVPADIPVETAVIPGHPAHVILELAESDHANLIVLGSRGLGAVKGLLMGSVSAAVIQKAPCPVMTTK